MERQTTRSPKAHVESLYHQPYFVPHDVIGESSKAALAGLGSGLFVAGIQNALSREAVGAFGIFTRGAPTIGMLTAAPTAYIFFSRTTMNLMEKDDAWAAAFGGFMGGAVCGLPFKKFAPMVGTGAFFGLTTGIFYLFGNRLDSFKEEEDEFMRKEIIRRTKRVPVEQTIANIGEGRGIKAPGYEERRRERIKEKYGFEIDPVKATVDDSQ